MSLSQSFLIARGKGRVIDASTIKPVIEHGTFFLDLSYGSVDL